MAEDQAPKQPRDEHEGAHDRVVKLHGTYTAFVAAAAVSLISGDGHIKTEGWAIALWTLSLPWLVSFLLLDYFVRTKQKRPISATRGLSAFFGYGLSTLGVSALLWFYSWVAAVAYPVAVLVCAIYVVEVSRLGHFQHFEKL